MTKEEAQKSIEDYREYFQLKGMFENEVYPGIEDLLNDLKNAGKTLIVATSKPELFAEKILEHFGLRKYFAYVAGASMDNSRLSKEAVIRYALEKGKIDDKSKVVMIGDRKHDILGAKSCGLDSVGVLYGYQ